MTLQASITVVSDPRLALETYWRWSQRAVYVTVAWYRPSEMIAPWWFCWSAPAKRRDWTVRKYSLIILGLWTDVEVRR